MSDSSGDESICSDVERSAAEAVASFVPEKSKLIYEKAYEKFSQYLVQNKVKGVTETVLLRHLNDRSKKLKGSSLWSEYSKLKCMIYFRQKVDISKFSGVIAFLKRKNVGFKPKKSKVLHMADFAKFIMEADDEKYLMMKVAFIFGIAGACRRKELTFLDTTDVIDHGSYIEVNIRDTKTHEDRQFFITEGGLKFDLLSIIWKYTSLRKSSTPHTRHFVSYQKEKCSPQPVGINTIGAIPKNIAIFCNLPETTLFTGHYFRRSSATLLADAGADLLEIKRHGGWRSYRVAQGYIESSTENKRKTARKILGVGTNGATVDTLRDANNRDMDNSCAPSSSQTVHVNDEDATDSRSDLVDGMNLMDIPMVLEEATAAEDSVSEASFNGTVPANMSAIHSSSQEVRILQSYISSDVQMMPMSGGQSRIVCSSPPNVAATIMPMSTAMGQSRMPMSTAARMPISTAMGQSRMPMSTAVGQSRMPMSTAARMPMSTAVRMPMPIAIGQSRMPMSTAVEQSPVDHPSSAIPNISHCTITNCTFKFYSRE